MLLNKKFNYQQLERITKADGDRHYIDPISGRKLKSVTTILDKTSHKPELEAWKLAVGPKKVAESKSDAVGIGNLLHAHLEAFYEGVERPKGNNLIRQMAARMADKIINTGLKNVTEIYGIEAPLYYPDLYAGTADLVCSYNGKMAIGDYKTTKRWKTKDDIEDYFCQACAYGAAHNYLHGTDINMAVIFMVSRELQCDTYIIEGNEFEDYSARWFLRLEKFLEDEAKNI